MIVSSQLFEAYIQCATKCWLRSRAERTTGNVYAEWARGQNEAYRQEAINRFLVILPEGDYGMAPPISKNFKDATWRIAIDVRLRTDELESCPQVVERITSESGSKFAKFILYHFEFANKLTKEHKLLLAFDALLLSEAVGCAVNLGKIVYGDSHATLKVKIPALASEARKRIKDIAALLARDTPPKLVLNRHCSQCEFQAHCRHEAMEKDDLSLLSGMSDKKRKRLHGKGVFTVTKLSHTFRPRRRRRELRGKQQKQYHSLRALAIREKKIHVVGIPDLKLDGTHVHLDVEGLPDHDFYYLIGVRVGTGKGAVQHTLWADRADEESGIWSDFLGILSGIPDPVLIHYGSYETTFLKRMRERYGGPSEDSPAAMAIKNATNLLSFVYAQIYFPTFSNGLKEIAQHLGLRRSDSPASGLEAIVWRHRWETSKDPALKQALVDYNRHDCEALELVTNRLIELYRTAPSEGKSLQTDVVLASELKWKSPYGFKRNTFAFPELATINKAAYWDYQRERVYVKSQIASKRDRPRRPMRQRALIPNATIEYQHPSSCPTCKSKTVYGHGKRRNKTVIDLRFMRYGIKRWITRYVAHRYRCPLCGSTFYPPEKRWTSKRYGSDLKAYAMYLNIELRLPQERIDSSMSKLFGLRLPRGATNNFKAEAADFYRTAYDALIKRLCCGRVLHVDETGVSVRGTVGYVWVLTSIDEVAYFHTPTREGGPIQALLKDFSGVLVSDFYAAYESIQCPQQKCLIHFIRDLNDALLKNPYDEDIRRLAKNFAALVTPMVETVDRWGLRKRYLSKHQIRVRRFYKNLADGYGASEAAGKLVERLQKNRNKMFTFLEFDDVPWNNNNAEHAVKAFATLCRVIEGPTTEKGLRDFLVLLSLCETCKYKNVDFLNFLRSGSKDIDDFAIESQSPAPLPAARAPPLAKRPPRRRLGPIHKQLSHNCHKARRKSLSGIHRRRADDIALLRDSVCRGACCTESLSRDGACSE
jgi:predicted RecB family nuclease